MFRRTSGKLTTPTFISTLPRLASTRTSSHAGPYYHVLTHTQHQRTICSDTKNGGIELGEQSALTERVANLVNQAMRMHTFTIRSLCEDSHLVDPHLKSYSPPDLHQQHLEELRVELEKIGLPVDYSSFDKRRLCLTGSLDLIADHLQSFVDHAAAERRIKWSKRKTPMSLWERKEQDESLNAVNADNAEVSVSNIKRG